MGDGKLRISLSPEKRRDETKIEVTIKEESK